MKKEIKKLLTNPPIGLKNINMREITLTLKKRWFDMILSGEKTEEYREIKWYWVRRLVGDYQNYQDQMPRYRGSYLMPFEVDRIRFKNGYAKDAPQFVIEWKSLDLNRPVGWWCPEGTDLTKFVFCLSLGKILETKNLKPSPKGETKKKYEI